MPYKSVSDLPDNVKEKYDGTGQKAFLAAFNSCWKDHEGDEGRCFATGYSAANKSKAKTERGGKNGSLRKKLIRLAYNNRDLRPAILPILKR